MNERKTVDVKIRFSPSDNEAILALCEELKIKRATWIRNTVLKEIEEKKYGTMKTNR